MTWRALNDWETDLLADVRKRLSEIIPLARLLVLTPRIEPLLLRNARVHFLPGSDAALEARLWFSPLVAARSTREIVLHLGIASDLAQDLLPRPETTRDHNQPADTDSPPSLDVLWRFTCEHTRHWPAEDRLERDLRYYALRRDDNALTQHLEAVLAKIVDADDPPSSGNRLEQQRLGLARLAKRTLPSLRESLGPRSKESARLLARYSALNLGDSARPLAEAAGAPATLPDWLQESLPTDLESSRLGVEVRSDAPGQHVLHFTPASESGSVLELPGPLPALLHIEPQTPLSNRPLDDASHWHVVKVGSRIALDGFSRVVQLTTMNGKRWNLVTEQISDEVAEETQLPLVIIHTEEDREQAEQIAAWLHEQGIQIERQLESTEHLSDAQQGAERVVRLWTQAMRELWALRPAELRQTEPESILLRTEAVEPPTLGAGAGRLLDWLDWQLLTESPQASTLAQTLEHWWRTGEFGPAEDSVLGDPAPDQSGQNDSTHAAEIDRLLEEIADPATPPPRRLAIGDRLAELGDPRPGVGTIEIEVPVDAPLDTGARPDPSPTDWMSELPSKVRALLDEIADPSTTPPRRLEIGDALARLGDPRPGVGLRPDGLPDIVWIEIPSGPFVYQNGETRELPTFWIARYPVTNAQYLSFIDDGGYEEPRWWVDLVRPTPQRSLWPQSNRPRTDINWYEAVAFTRWLNAKLGLPEGSLRLPTELEWEKAARGEHGRIYPWGEEYRSGYANVDETSAGAGQWSLGQTTAVGLYPHGDSSEGVADLAGNVLDWCLNKVDDVTVVTPGEFHVLRGAWWIFDPDNARSTKFYGRPPEDRSDSVGFRLLSSEVPLEFRPPRIDVD
ncbi:SUMF1/EgtB/PvdO family nonheme iron enzyme [Marichromatium gracile]|uniref:SUMF1/EgtB/PvdO family nonheme iron enzyme n=1 Tax=Marichromatium gracile TaxID=1048 RepID=UPI001F197D1B|nr:SUMF1/EgtB/PvdO family nonheme iron enzyme [Marichromatium gracile]MCF1182437.1 SUMF1/EgtB/PvdO family nonheme iron enzyme [Marichromatium gracile]